LFLNMSVKENVMAACYGHTKAGIVRSMLRTPGMRREEREIEEVARKRLSFFGQRLMGYRWDQPAYSLSYANRRRLEIARAPATRARRPRRDAGVGADPGLAPARRPGRRHEPRRDARDHRADRAAAKGGRLHD